MIPKATFEGRIRNIFDSEIVGNNGFEKRKIYLEETEGRYPNIWHLECQQGKCNELDNFSIGDEVRVQVEIQGRPWTSRKTGEEIIFMTHKVLDIQLVSGRYQAQAKPAAVPGSTGDVPPQAAQPSTSAKSTSEPVKDCPQPEPDDDLPF